MSCGPLWATFIVKNVLHWVCLQAHTCSGKRTMWFSKVGHVHGPTSETAAEWWCQRVVISWVQESNVWCWSRNSSDLAKPCQSIYYKTTIIRFDCVISHLVSAEVQQWLSDFCSVPECNHQSWFYDMGVFELRQCDSSSQSQNLGYLCYQWPFQKHQQLSKGKPCKEAITAMDIPFPWVFKCYGWPLIFCSTITASDGLGLV